MHDLMLKLISLDYSPMASKTRNNNNENNLYRVPFNKS